MFSYMLSKENQTYYLTAQESPSEFVCTTAGRQSCERGEAYPIGKHPLDHLFPREGRVLNEYQIVYITEGQGWFYSDSTPLTKIEAGTAIFLRPGERHRYYPDQETGWSEFWVGFLTENPKVKELFDNGGPLRDVGLSDTICVVYEKIISIAKFEKLGAQDALSGFIAALLGYMRYLESNKNPIRLRYQDSVEKAQILIRESIENKISPSKIASQLGMSYSLLREKFKSTTGLSMSEYLLGQRLGKAKDLLASTDKTISEIAFETGYDSLARFCCAFKQAIGISATEWRERNGGKKQQSNS